MTNLIETEERKNKKNKNKNNNNYNYVSPQNKFEEALEYLVDNIESEDKNFWTLFVNEYLTKFQDNRPTAAESKALGDIYAILTGDKKVKNITNYTEAEKQVSNVIEWYEDEYYKIPHEENDVEPTGDVKVLMDFLSLPINRTKEVFQKFGGNDGNYHYIEGSLPPGKRVLILAHADTVWDGQGSKYEYANPYIENGTVFPSNPHSGLGADDRAGLAMMYILKNSGHSLLITNYEEVGRVGAKALVAGDKELHKHLQDTHNFMIQLDRQGASDYKCYYVGSGEFRNFINKNTFFSEPSRSSFTDICTLCETVCGVNFSVGYYDEHRVAERLVIDEWQRVLDFLKTFLKGDLPRFDLKPEKNIYQGGYSGRGSYDWREDYEDDAYGSAYGSIMGDDSEDLDNEEDGEWENIDFDDGYEGMTGMNDDVPDEKITIDDKSLKKMKRFLDRVPKGKSKKQEFGGQWFVYAQKLTDDELEDMLYVDAMSDADIVDQFVLEFWEEVGFKKYRIIDKGIWGENTVFAIFQKLKKKPKKSGGGGKSNRSVTGRNGGTTSKVIRGGRMGGRMASGGGMGSVYPGGPPRIPFNADDDSPVYDDVDWNDFP